MTITQDGLYGLLLKYVCKSEEEGFRFSDLRISFFLYNF